MSLVLPLKLGADLSTLASVTVPLAGTQFSDAAAGWDDDAQRARLQKVRQMCSIMNNAQLGKFPSVTLPASGNSIQVVCHKSNVAKMYKLMEGNQSKLAVVVKDVQSCVKPGNLDVSDMQAVARIAVGKLLAQQGWHRVSPSLFLDTNFLDAAQLGPPQQSCNMLELEVLVQPPDSLLVAVHTLGPHKFSPFRVESGLADAGGASSRQLLADIQAAGGVPAALRQQDAALRRRISRALQGEVVCALPAMQKLVVQGVRAPASGELPQLKAHWQHARGYRLPDAAFDLLLEASFSLDAEEVCLLPGSCAWTPAGLVPDRQREEPGARAALHARLVEQLTGSCFMIFGGQPMRLHDNGGGGASGAAPAPAGPAAHAVVPAAAAFWVTADALPDGMASMGSQQAAQVAQLLRLHPQPQQQQQFVQQQSWEPQQDGGSLQQHPQHAQHAQQQRGALPPRRHPRKEAALVRAEWEAMMSKMTAVLGPAKPAPGPPPPADGHAAAAAGGAPAATAGLPAAPAIRRQQPPHLSNPTPGLARAADGATVTGGKGGCSTCTEPAPVGEAAAVHLPTAAAAAAVPSRAASGMPPVLSIPSFRAPGGKPLVPVFRSAGKGGMGKGGSTTGMGGKAPAAGQKGAAAAGKGSKGRAGPAGAGAGAAGRKGKGSVPGQPGAAPAPAAGVAGGGGPAAAGAMLSAVAVAGAVPGAAGVAGPKRKAPSKPRVPKGEQAAKKARNGQEAVPNSGGTAAAAPGAMQPSACAQPAAAQPPQQLQPAGAHAGGWAVAAVPVTDPAAGQHSPLPLATAGPAATAPAAWVPAAWAPAATAPAASWAPAASAPAAMVPAAAAAPATAAAKKDAPARARTKAGDLDYEAVAKKVLEKHAAGRLGELSIPEMKCYLKALKQPLGGKKADLEARLAAVLPAAWAPGAAAAGGASAAGAGACACAGVGAAASGAASAVTAAAG